MLILGSYQHLLLLLCSLARAPMPPRMLPALRRGPLARAWRQIKELILKLKLELLIFFFNLFSLAASECRSAATGPAARPYGPGRGQEFNLARLRYSETARSRRAESPRGCAAAGAGQKA
eukprot:750756-Hanusia_phi.AAC.6